MPQIALPQATPNVDTSGPSGPSGPSSGSAADTQHSCASQTQGLQSSPPTSISLAPPGSGNDLRALIQQYANGQEVERLSTELEKSRAENDRLRSAHTAETNELKSALGKVWRLLYRSELDSHRLHATLNSTVIFREVNNLDPSIISTMNDVHDKDEGLLDCPVLRHP